MELNDKEWKELQERVKEYDRQQSNHMGVNIFTMEFTLKENLNTTMCDEIEVESWKSMPIRMRVNDFCNHCEFKCDHGKELIELNTDTIEANKELAKLKMGVKICPRCGESYLHHSLSRLDNKTKICGNCGNWEAMTDYRFLFGFGGTENNYATFEEINDRLNVLGTLKGTKGKTNNHEFLYFEKIENLLNTKLETLIKSN